MQANVQTSAERLSALLFIAGAEEAQTKYNRGIKQYADEPDDKFEKRRQRRTTMTIIADGIMHGTRENIFEELVNFAETVHSDSTDANQRQMDYDEQLFALGMVVQDCMKGAARLVLKKKFGDENRQATNHAKDTRHGMGKREVEDSYRDAAKRDGKGEMIPEITRQEDRDLDEPTCTELVSRESTDALIESLNALFAELSQFHLGIQSTISWDIFEPQPLVMYTTSRQDDPEQKWDNCFTFEEAYVAYCAAIEHYRLSQVSRQSAIVSGLRNAFGKRATSV